MKTGGVTDMTKPIVAFLNFTKAPKNESKLNHYNANYNRPLIYCVIFSFTCHRVVCKLPMYTGFLSNFVYTNFDVIPIPLP